MAFFEDLRAYREGVLAQGFWALQIYRFGHLRYRFNSKLIRIPLAVIHIILLKFSEIFFGITIGVSAKIGKRLVIEHFGTIVIHGATVIGDDCIVGDNSIIHPGVKVYSGNRIGSDCEIHSGTVIGSDGFRFEPSPEGAKKVPQIGNVVIEDDVEIGANCAIDRATFGSTILRRGVKFDNLVHIAHNVEIGENSFLTACNVVAGSTKIGKNCMFSGQVGIVGHLTIADNTIITAQSGISKSITKPGGVYMGSPAFDANKYRKAYIHFRNLDALSSRVDALEKQSKEDS